MGVLAILGLSGVLFVGPATLDPPPAGGEPSPVEFCSALREIAELPPCAGPDGCRARELLATLLGPDRGPRWAAPLPGRPAAGGFVVAAGARMARAETRTAPLAGDLLALARVVCEAGPAAAERSEP